MCLHWPPSEPSARSSPPPSTLALGGRAGGSGTMAPGTGSEELRQKVELKAEIEEAVGQGGRKDPVNGRGRASELPQRSPSDDT